MTGQKLHTDRQSGGGESARHGDAGNSGQVCRDRENIGQIHLQRIIRFLADFKRGRRRGGCENHIAFLKGFVKIPADERPHLRGFAVVSVIVTGGQGVGADHDAAFDFRAESLHAGLCIHLGRDRARPLSGIRT